MSENDAAKCRCMEWLYGKPVKRQFTEKRIYRVHRRESGLRGQEPMTWPEWVCSRSPMRCPARDNAGPA